MFRAASWCSLTLAVCALMVCGAKPRTSAPVQLEYNAAGSNQASAPPAPEKAASASETVNWQAVLNKRVDLQKGLDPMPLQEAVENLRDQFRVPILIDAQAFRRDLSDDDVGGKQVKLQVMKDVRLATMLRFLCDQVNGAYIANADHLEIVPATRVRPADRPLLPLVYANFKQKELADVLEELSDQTDHNIVLDNRLLEKYGKLPITANLRNLPVDTAVRVVAECAGLKIVVLDNLIFVTQAQTAKQMEKEKEARTVPGMA
jgi:hypothetical protein